MYARQRHGSRVHLVRELVGFARATLAAGERTIVEVEVPVDRLGCYKPREGHVTEPGEYREVGDDAVTVDVPDAE